MKARELHQPSYLSGEETRPPSGHYLAKIFTTQRGFTALVTAAQGGAGGAGKASIQKCVCLREASPVASLPQGKGRISKLMGNKEAPLSLCCPA